MTPSGYPKTAIVRSQSGSPEPACNAALPFQRLRSLGRARPPVEPSFGRASRSLALLTVLLASPSFSAPEPDPTPTSPVDPASYQSHIPRALFDKIESLFELHKDSTSVWLPNWEPGFTSDGWKDWKPPIIQIRTLGLEGDQTIVLVQSVIENQGDTMGCVVYLAAFHQTKSEEGTAHYRYMDSIPIGGKGWRFSDSLADATIHHDQEGEKVFIEIEAKETQEWDGPNFPSKPTKIQLILKGDRFREQPHDDAITPPYGRGNNVYDCFWSY